MLRSKSAAGLTSAELLEIKRIFDSFPIELVELRAGAKQILFQDAFFKRRHPVTGLRCDIFVAMGGNRSGKTVTAGCMCFAKYLRDKAKNGDAFWCVAPNLEKSIGAAGGQQRELWNALPRWMFGNQVWDPKIGFSHSKVVLPTRDGGQCVVEFRTAKQEPSTFEAGKLTGVWADERLPESIYNRLLARIIDRSGFILYSDIPEQFWHTQRLKEAAPEAGIFYQHFTMYDNAANLPPGEIELTWSRMTEDDRKLRIKGESIVMEGIVFKEYIDKLKPDGHLCRPFPIPAHWPKWRLIDYGASAPTAGLWTAIAPNENAYVYREHYERNLSVGENAKMIIAASGDEKYVATLIDPHAFDKPPATYGSAGTVADQYAAAGIATMPWPFIQVMGEHACVQRIKYRYEHRTLFVFENLINHRRECRSWTYQLDADGKPKAADAFENDNNHTIDDLKGWLAMHPNYTQGGVKVVGEEV